jgi:hypothetical protein
MTFRFVVRSQTGQIIGGLLELPAGTTVRQATIKVAHEAARVAYLMGTGWDPFNLSIAITQIHRRKPNKHASHK